MTLQLTGEPNWKIYSYSGKTLLCALLNKAIDISTKYMGAVQWIQEFSRECSQLLYNSEYINSNQGKVLIASADSMVESIKINVQDWQNMPLDALGVFAKPKECIHLMTMHSSKGMEFDAVAIIDFHDGKIPHFSSFNNPKELNEGKRLTYVAATRAKKFLMFFSDSTDTRNPPSRFLNGNCLGFR